MIDFKLFIENCDADLRAGKISVCAERLRALNLAKIPREFHLSLANLCRRCGLWSVGLRLLSPWVRSDRGILTTATPHEKAEYAVLLMKNGSVGEAIRILKLISANEVGEAPMYLAFCEMALWNYDSAIEYLKSYLAGGPALYQALVARVNLASALVWTERPGEALPLLNQLIAASEESGSLRLKANCLELRSQLYLQARDFDNCRADLDEARKILVSQTSDQLFVRKWQAILMATETDSLGPIEMFREEAFRRQHWESLRDCDFYSLKIRFDQNIFNRLICGTPYESYRRKVCATLGREMPAGRHIHGVSGGPCFDTHTGSLSGGPGVKPGKKIHQVMNALLKDFYKPISLGALFFELFPQEYFNVLSSPGRIHQLIWRTRRYFAKADLPLEIEALDAGLQLRILGKFSFDLSFDRKTLEGPQAQLEKLKRNLTRNPFTTYEASSLLDLSPPSARRLLRWGVQNHKLMKEGAGPSIKYRLVA